MPDPFVSIRKSIRWLPGPPSEPTSTVVLTSAAGCFIDVRLFKSAVTNREAYVSGKDDDVEWAFAGYANSSPAQDGRPAHTVWNHWIDSKNSVPSSDQGDMYPLPDGDVLEKGNMQNPRTGKDCDYEELWRDLNIQVLDSEKHRVCVALKADSASTGIKGMAMRIGDWHQAILETEHGLTVERWQWLDIGDVPGEKALGQGRNLTPQERWVRLARFGSGSLPSPSALNPTNLADGAFLELNGIAWKVIETYQW